MSSPIPTHPRFSGPVSYFRLPATQLEEARIKIIGAPFDTGATFRSGYRFAPRSVREASLMLGAYHPDLDVNFHTHKVKDAGDLILTLNDSEANLKLIEEAVFTEHSRGVRTALVGGDHSLLLAELRALHRVHGEIALLHFDSHADVGGAAYGEEFHHGTPIKHAVEEGIIEGKNIFQVGIRGPTWTPEQQSYVHRKGIRVLERKHLAEFVPFITEAKKQIGQKPVHLTFDVDLIDPAFAPAAGTPLSGGISPYEAMTFLRQLKDFNLVSADVCEVTPCYDVADLTSQLGAALLYEELALLCQGA